MAALCLPLAGAAADDVPAQPYDWRNVTVGAGGFAPNVIFSRAEPNLAYLRTDMGGAYRWDAGQERWIPLQDGNPVGSYMGIESIAADPANPAVVYLAAGMSRWGEASIWRSEDRGTTWTVPKCRSRWAATSRAEGWGSASRSIPTRPRRCCSGRAMTACSAATMWGGPGARSAASRTAGSACRPIRARPTPGSASCCSTANPRRSSLPWPTPPSGISTARMTAERAGPRCRAGRDRRCSRSRATSTRRAISTSPMRRASAPTTSPTARSGGSTPAAASGATSRPTRPRRVATWASASIARSPAGSPCRASIAGSLATPSGSARTTAGPGTT